MECKGEEYLQGRTNWAHFYIEDGWQITPSLKLDIGLRYEYNQNVTDANNNMAIINTLVPGGEFVIASNSQGQISPAASALLADYSDSVRHFRAGRLEQQSASGASPPAGAADRTGLGFAGPQDGDPFGIWNLYQSGGIQHHSKCRAESALLFCQDGDE